jgi:hypothetical protein
MNPKYPKRIRKILKHLRLYKPERIYLFGSWARISSKDGKFQAFQESARELDLHTQNGYYCHIRGMGEKPSPLGEDFSLILAKGFNG